MSGTRLIGEVRLSKPPAEADQQHRLVNAARINSNAYDVVSWTMPGLEFAANRWVVEICPRRAQNDDILEPVWKACTRPVLRGSLRH